MRYDDLRRVFLTLGFELPPPNHSGWSHIACPYAPWKHRNGVDKSKGFAVKTEDNGVSAFNCPACKTHGRIERLVRDMGTLRQQDVTELLALVTSIETRTSMSLPAWDARFSGGGLIPSYEPLPDPLDPVLFDPCAVFEDPELHPVARDYLHARRISQEAIRLAEIRYDPDKNRVVFPVRDRKGDLYGFTGRTLIRDHHPKVLDYANLPKRLLILGEHLWQPRRPVVIVEGLFAYARFLTEGIHLDYNVGALLGSELTPGKAAILKTWALPVYLFLDPDEAGDAGIFGRLREVGPDPHTGEMLYERDVTTGALFALCKHVPVHVPAYPEGVNDPDYLTREQIVQMIQRTPPSPHVEAPKSSKSKKVRKI